MSRRATVRGRPWRVRGGSSHGAKSAHSASLRSVGYAFCLAMPPGYTRPQPLFQTRSKLALGLVHFCMPLLLDFQTAIPRQGVPLRPLGLGPIRYATTRCDLYALAWV